MYRQKFFEKNRKNLKKVVDKTGKLCYIIITKGKEKEIKKMMYIRSKITGQVYEVECLPQYGDFDVVSKATYEEWKKKMGL